MRTFNISCENTIHLLTAVSALPNVFFNFVLRKVHISGAEILTCILCNYYSNKDIE